MFIKRLQIKNFKCFDRNTKVLDFNIPDNKTPGSGLNIFVGNNNTGKSTVFKAIDFFRNGEDQKLDDIKNKKSLDGDDVEVEVTFTGNISDTINNFVQINMQKMMHNHVYLDNDTNEELFRIARRFDDNVNVLQAWDDRESRFKNRPKINTSLQMLYETSFIWANTSPDEKSSFSSKVICENFLNEITKRLKEKDDFKDLSEQVKQKFINSESGLKKELKGIETRAQEILSEQFGGAKVSFHFKEPQIDSFFRNIEIEIDDGIPTQLLEKGSGLQRSIVISLLQVHAEELSKHAKKESFQRSLFSSYRDTVKPFFLFIDEPEICLHPQAQLKLLKALLELSKTKQIFIATHSPYFFRDANIKNTGLFLFKRNNDQEFEILDNKNKNLSILPWGPSWGEINYYAYDLPTIELHNELYGYLQTLYIKEHNKTSTTDFDIYLQEKIDTENMKSYKNLKKGQKEKITLCTYIRHQTHHPENKSNTIYTDNELKQSINLLINAVQPSP